MGCGSSKGVALAPGSQPAAASPAKDGQGAQPAAASDAAALHKQRLEQQHSQKQDGAQHQQQQQGHVSLPGRIESTTAPAPPPNLLKELPEVVDLPRLRKSNPAKAATDAEFDYGKELQRGAALGSGGGAPPVSSAQGGVVGGLLSKQPDWLRGSNTDPSTAKLPALAPAQAGAAPAGKAASSLPPLVGRGMGAAAGGGSSSLPPLAAGGARALVPAGSQHKPQEAESDAEGPDVHGAGGAAHAEGGHAGKQAASDKHSDSSSSSASSSRRSSPVHAPTSTAAAAAAAQGQSNMEPADPWNSLQSQYTHGSPSPDSSIAGGSPPAAAVAPTSMAAAGAPGASSLPPLQGAAAAGAAAGSRRTTGSRQPEARLELVLVDSDEEAAEPKPQQQQQHKPGSGLAAAGTNRSSFSSSSGGGRISTQASQHSVGSGVPPHVAKSGGWGVGSLAGAGTIMLGDESSGVRRSPGVPHITAAASPAAPAGTGTAAAHDDVFGDDEYEAPVLPKGLGAAHAASLAAEGSSSMLRASHSRARVGDAAVPAAAAAAAAQQETLAVEEIEDEFDEDPIMMQSRDGLPADLAAKLAQFEAAGVADGSHSEEEVDGSESPTIFSIMNNRQGSWRAA